MKTVPLQVARKLEVALLKQMTWAEHYADLLQFSAPSRAVPKVWVKDRSQARAALAALMEVE